MSPDHSKYRADNQRCFISGIQGTHPIRVGIAYFYRGHYIYSIAGLPIEPQAFATKGRTIVAGITADSAPRFDDLAPGLAREEDIGALWKAEMTERYFGLDGSRAAEHDPELAQHAFEDDGHGNPKTQTPTAPDILVDNTPPTSFQQPVLESPDRLSVPRRSRSLRYTPHDRARFLAVSAPGSRYMSRSSSPVHDEEKTNLRHAFSSARFGDLFPVAEGASTPPTEWMDNDTILGAISPFHVDSDPFSLADLSDEPGPTLTMNRVRRASVRLNEAYNMSHPEPKVTVCPIHGEGCDGETVTEPHLTEQMHRARKQFVELVPLVKGEDGIRGMIDWEGLLKQEQGRM